SNKTTTKTNPAISRLSASPTPGNDPRHPNVARGVRETYIEPDLCCIEQKVRSKTVSDLATGRSFTSH
ncbi:MAG: hypothetical protein ACI9U6_002849, partial [Loktanella salsilacus]|uniref:hypothetical protein n=1 Tax=Loktanella salsilacus TaxID=195913 RepID=UPI003989F5A0